MRAVVVGIVATVVAGCAAPPPVVEMVEIVCPSIAPPTLYALPPRREEFVTPEDYSAERAVLEGRHRGFAGELEAWRETWAECPGRDARHGRP